MKLKYFFTKLCLLSICVWCSSVHAEFVCSFDLKFGIVVANGHVRVLDESRTLYQINNHQQVFVGGKLVELPANNIALIERYAKGLEHVIPEITLLAKEGIGLLADNIMRVYSGLVGDNSSGLAQLHQSMKKAKENVKEKYGFNGNYYYIDAGYLEADSNDDISLQEQITSGFSNVSGILTAIATVDISKDSENTEDEYMLQKRAKKACRKLAALNEIEQQIQQEIVSLKKLDAITPIKTK